MNTATHYDHQQTYLFTHYFWRSYSDVNERQIETILDLCYLLFNDFSLSRFWERLKNKNNIYLVQCFDIKQNICVGFKLGFELDLLRYYSSLGGVHPNFRGKGIASHLMQLQHNWATHQKYQWIVTKSENSFKPMMSLNLKNNFDITHTETTQSGKIKIVFQKKLTK